MLGMLIGFFIFYLCFSAGRTILGLFRLSGINSDEEFVLGTALGLGVLSYVVLIFGLLHVLSFWCLWGALALFTGLAISKVRNDLRVLSQAFQCWSIPLGTFNRIIFVLGGLVLLASFAGLLTPDTSNDSLCYHLHLPKIFLAQGVIGPVPYEFNAFFPFFMEMLYTLGLGVYGLTLAQFFHFALGILATLGIVVFVRRQVPVQYAWWGAILFFTTPVVVNQYTTTYVDVGLACFAWLALMATFRWIETRQTGWILIAGIFSGFALSIKYLGLISVAGIFLIALWEICFRKRGAKNDWSPLGVFCAGALACSFYWYLRSYLELGNPVFPYFAKLFGYGDATIHYNDVGFPKTWLNFFLSPWRMTMFPEKFEGFGVHIGPAYLAFLPLAFMTIRKIQGVLALSFFSIFFMGCWFLLGQDMRFFVLALPGLAALIAFGFSQFDKPDLAGKGMRALLIVSLCFNAGLAFYHFRDSFKVAVGLETRTNYLTRVERSYPAADFANKNLPVNSKILAVDESHLFYFKRPIVRESVYSFFTGYEKKALSEKEALARVARENFTHILLVENGTVQDRFQALPAMRLARILRGESDPLANYLTLVDERKFEGPGGIWNYRLYRIERERL